MPRSFGELSPSVVHHASRSDSDSDTDVPMEAMHPELSDSSESGFGSGTEGFHGFACETAELEFELHDVEALFHQLSDKMIHLNQSWSCSSSASGSSASTASSSSTARSTDSSSSASSFHSMSSRSHASTSDVSDTAFSPSTSEIPLPADAGYLFERRPTFHTMVMSRPASPPAPHPFSSQLESFINEAFFMQPSLPSFPPSSPETESQAPRLPRVPQRAVRIPSPSPSAQDQLPPFSLPDTAFMNRLLSYTAEGKKQASNASPSKPSLSEFLRCFICFGTMQKAVMCPHCSKMGCHDCLEKWITEQRSTCPHCRAHLEASGLIPCRFIEDLYRHFQGLVETHADHDDCKEHHKTLYYFCEQCEDPICSDCAMFDDKHRGHGFIHLDKLYSVHVAKINEEKNRLISNVPHFIDAMKKVDVELKSLHEAKIKARAEIQVSMEEAQRNLEMHLKDKHKCIEEYKSGLELQFNQIDEVLNLAQDAVLHYPHSKFVRHAPSLLIRMKSCDFTPHAIDFTPFQYSVATQPEFEASPVITLPDLSTFAPCEPYVTEVYWISGVAWRLKIYPLGNAKSKAHVSLFLERVQGHTEVRYSVKVVPLRHPALSRTFSAHFPKHTAVGFSHFYPRALLATPLTQHAFEVQFFVRPLSYRQRCDDLEKYIAWLKAPEPIPEISKELEEVEVAHINSTMLPPFTQL